MGEDICKPWDQQEITLSNIQIAHAAQYKKIEQPNKEHRQKNTYLFQRRYTDSQQAREKINIANY